MKPSHLAIALVLLILPFFVSYVIDTKATDTQNETTSELNKAMANSLYEAALVSDMKLEEADCRIGFYENFLDVLGHSLGYNASEDYMVAMEQNIPMVIFCVEDGYYCVFSDYNALTATFRKTTGVLIPYSRQYGNYNVTFNMSGKIGVLNMVSGAYNEGMFPRIYEKLGKPNDLSFCESVAEYEAELSSIIAERITLESEYLIENHNYGNSEPYSIRIPMGESSDIRTITQPCIISMYQGDTMSTNGSRVDIYTFSCVEIQDLVPFEVYTEQGESGEVILYYHRCTGQHKGVNVIASGTQEFCASLGANPCPMCP